MKTVALTILTAAILGLVIGTLDAMEDRTLATALSLSGMAVALLALAKWVK
jgi:type III secretory pathway component EscS